MKKHYEKPVLQAEEYVVTDVIAASGSPNGVLDTVSDGFEKNTDGILDFFNDLGNGI